MDCGGVLVKYILFISNILFLICGILLIVFGSIIIANMGDFSSFEKTWEVNGLPILIIVLGCVIFLLAFMGCCGAIRESSCCTLTYSIIMLILFVCQVTLIVYVWINRNDISTSMKKFVQDVWDQRTTAPALMDSLQISFKCCGNRGPYDYGLSIPNSCCGATATSCSVLDVAQVSGCSSAMVDFWNKNLSIIQYAGLGVAAVEMCAFIFGFCLYNGIRNSGRRSNY